MKNAALGERVHALQRLGLFERRETIRRGQEKSIRTGRELLKRGYGIRTCIQPLLLKERPRRIGDADEAVVLRPLLSRARPAFRDRSLQGRVQRQHVMRASFDIIAAEHQPAEHGEVVLEVVYRIRRIGRSRPCEVRVRLLRCRELERLMVWDPAGDRAHDLERVKRRHARAGFG